MFVTDLVLQLEEKTKRKGKDGGDGGWRMADVRILGFGASKPLSLSYYYIYIPLDDDPRP